MFEAVADRQWPTGHHLERAQLRRAFLESAPHRFAPDRVRLTWYEEDRQPTLGELGGKLHAAVAQRGQVDRNPGAAGVRQHLERLAEAGTFFWGQRQAIGFAAVFERVSTPDHATDFDDLSRPLHGPVVGDAMPAFDDLRPGGPESEDGSPFRQLVEPGSGLRQQRRRARVDRKDARAELHAVGAGCQIAQPRGRIVAIGLGHPDHVHAHFFELLHALDRLHEAIAIAETARETH